MSECPLTARIEPILLPMSQGESAQNIRIRQFFSMQGQPLNRRSVYRREAVQRYTHPKTALRSLLSALCALFSALRFPLSALCSLPHDVCFAQSSSH